MVDVEASLEQFIRSELLLDPSGPRIDEHESLLDSHILDSLALMRLVFFVEEQFGISVEDGEVTPDNFQTINLIKAFVERKKGDTL